MKKVALVAEGAAAQTLAFVLNRAASLFFFVFLLRFFRPAVLGKYYLLGAFLGLAGLLGAGWFNDVLPVFLPKRKGSAVAYRWLAHPLVFAVLVGFLAYPALLFFGLACFWFEFMLVLLLSVIAGWGGAFLGAEKKFIPAALSGTVNAWVRVIALVVFGFVFGMWDVRALLLAQATAFLFCFLVQLPFLARMLKRPKSVFDFGAWKEEASFAFQSAGARLIRSVIGWTDLFVLKLFFGYETAGAYGVLRSLASSLVGFLPSALAGAMLPVFSGETNEKQKLVWARAQRWFFRFSAFGLVLALCSAGFALPIFFQKYLPYAWLFPLLCFAAFVRSAMLYVRAGLRAQLNMRPILLCSFGEASANALLDVVFALLLGPVGVVLSSCFVAVGGELLLLLFSGLPMPSLQPSFGLALCWLLLSAKPYAFASFASLIFASPFILFAFALTSLAELNRAELRHLIHTAGALKNRASRLFQLFARL